jgi:hypothetical protein
MVSSVINSLRVFKGLYDLAFSEEQFYVEQRAEFLGAVRLGVEQAKEGYRNPLPAQAFVRKPYKVLLGILMFVLFLAYIQEGRGRRHFAGHVPALAIGRPIYVIEIVPALYLEVALRTIEQGDHPDLSRNGTE